MSWICSHCGESSPRPRPKCARDGSPVVEDLAGQEVGGRYRVQELIGVGGMDSAVWKAWQMGTERVVAIKVLPPADEAAARRFSRGARIAANLSHPNCCVIHDYGTTEDGKLYLVMEFLAGKVLNELLTDDGFSPHDTAHIADQILQALEHAHAERAVHRDLKPDNLFLCRRNNDPYHVKILDFGIAKYVEDAHEELSTGPNDTARDGFDDLVTEQRQVCGTPQYMAPEQVVGARVDGRADLYALGCVMYRLLTGRLPFDGKNRYDLYRKHLEESPRPFSEIRPDLTFPDRLELVVMKALAKNPAHRFQNAAEMRAALASIDLGSQQHRRTGPGGSNELTVEVPVPGPAPATRQIRPVGTPAPAPTVAGGSGLRSQGAVSQGAELPPTTVFESPGMGRGPVVPDGGRSSGPGQGLTGGAPRPFTTQSLDGTPPAGGGGRASASLVLGAPEGRAAQPTMEARIPIGSSTEPSSAGTRSGGPRWQVGVVLAAAFLVGVGGVALLTPGSETEGEVPAAAVPREVAVTVVAPTSGGERAVGVTPTTDEVEPGKPQPREQVNAASTGGGQPEEAEASAFAASAWPLRIESIPPGARVLRAGHEIGRAPLTVDVGPGTHVFTLRAEGYADATTAVTVRSQADVERPRQVILGAARGRAAVAAPPGAMGSGGAMTAPQRQAAPTGPLNEVGTKVGRPQQGPAPAPSPTPPAPAEAPRKPRATTLDELDNN